MKYIAYTLLMINLLYFAYSQFYMPILAEPQTTNSPPADHSVATLKLLGEAGSQVNRQQQMSEVVNNPILSAGQASAECVAAGPFNSVTEGQAILERLRAMELKVDLQAIDQPTGGFDYRVLIAPASSLEEAFRKLRELQSQGIDSYVITQGQYALGISMGVYSSVAAAKLVQDQLAAEGYQTEVIEIARLNREYWIFSRTNKNLLLDDGVLERYQEDFPQMGLSQQICVTGGGIGE